MRFHMPVVARQRGEWRVDTIPVDFPELSSSDAPIAARIRHERDELTFASHEGRLFSRMSVRADHRKYMAFMESKEQFETYFHNVTKAPQNELIWNRPEDYPVHAELQLGLDDPESTTMARMVRERASSIILIDDVFHEVDVGPAIRWMNRDTPMRIQRSGIGERHEVFGLNEIDIANEWARSNGQRADMVAPTIELWDHTQPPKGLAARALEHMPWFLMDLFRRRHASTLSPEHLEAFVRARGIVRSRNLELWGVEQDSQALMGFHDPALRDDAADLVNSAVHLMERPSHRNIFETMTARIALHRGIDTALQDLNGFRL